jgi:hypothetical protein
VQLQGAGERTPNATSRAADRAEGLDTLEPGADPSRLADVAAVLSDSEMLVLLVDTYGWCLDAAVDYIQQLLERELSA